MAEIVPIIQLQFLDNNGDPLSGGKIYSYEAGTTTPKATYKDLAGAEANTNPIVLDSAGRPPYDVRIISGVYKFLIKDANDNTLETYDDVQSFSSLTNTSGALAILNDLSDLNDNDTAIANLETGATGGDIVQTARAQTLTNKTIDADNNTISNLAHGSEVDNPSSGVHGVTGSIVGTTDAQTLTNKTLTSPVLNTGVSGTAVLDEDNMASDSATQLATQQSIKAYADTKTAKSTLTTKGDIYAASAASTPTRLGVGTDGYVLTADSTQSTGIKWAAPGNPTAPVVTKYTSGSGTHNITGSPLYIRVVMVGGGGGGGASGTASFGTSGNGGATSFGTSLLVANGGGGGTQTGSGGGGTASLGTGPVGIATTGGQGQGGGYQSSNTTQQPGGQGGVSPLGGGGAGGYYNTNGVAAVANTGSGGGGAGFGGVSGSYAGAGGAAGGYIDAIITSPSSSYSYSVGAGGAGGSAGASGFAGGAGGSGLILVYEFYQ